MSLRFPAKKVRTHEPPFLRTRASHRLRDRPDVAVRGRRWPRRVARRDPRGLGAHRGDQRSGGGLAASAPRERWAIDFVHDTLADGRPFRVLSVVDVFSRSSEVLEPGIGFSGARVAEVLERAAKGRLPAVITADNGTEFTSKALDAWAFERGVKLDFIRPGKPTENGFVESFQEYLRRWHSEAAAKKQIS